MRAVHSCNSWLDKFIYFFFFGRNKSPSHSRRNTTSLSFFQAVAGELKYAFKIFEYDGTTADFAPNGKFDRPGDLIIYGICYYDDLTLSVAGGVTFK